MSYLYLPCEAVLFDIVLTVGTVAQLVEQWTENPCVAGSIPAGPTTFF